MKDGRPYILRYVTQPLLHDVDFGRLEYESSSRSQLFFLSYGAQVKVVSCHPGWTLTEGVEAAYGESKKYLEVLLNMFLFTHQLMNS